MGMKDTLSSLFSQETDIKRPPVVKKESPETLYNESLHTSRCRTDAYVLPGAKILGVQWLQASENQNTRKWSIIKHEALPFSIVSDNQKLVPNTGQTTPVKDSLSFHEMLTAMTVYEKGNKAMGWKIAQDNPAPEGEHYEMAMENEGYVSDEQGMPQPAPHMIIPDIKAVPLPHDLSHGIVPENIDLTDGLAGQDNDKNTYKTAIKHWKQESKNKKRRAQWAKNETPFWLKFIAVASLGAVLSAAFYTMGSHILGPYIKESIDNTPPPANKADKHSDALDFDCISHTPSDKSDKKYTYARSDFNRASDGVRILKTARDVGSVAWRVDVGEPLFNDSEPPQKASYSYFPCGGI